MLQNILLDRGLTKISSNFKEMYVPCNDHESHKFTIQSNILSNVSVNGNWLTDYS